MADITIAVVVNPPTHTIPKPQASAGRYVFGDISQVYDTADLADFINGEYKFRQPIAETRRTKFIHIVGPPDFDKGLLAQPIKAGHDYLRTSLYLVRDLPPNLENALDREGEITLQWADFLNVLFKKSIVDPLDASQDVLISASGDFDINGPA